MPAIDAILEYLSWLEIVAYVVLFVRLRRQGLHRVYRVFALYLLFRAARSVALAVLPWACYGIWGRPYGQFENNVYGWVWVLTEPLVWVLQVLVVLELYSLVRQNFKGIASMGRWVLLAGLTVAILLSSVTLPSELSHSAQHYTLLRSYFVVSRGLDASLVIFLLFISAFLAWFPVPLNRNVVLYSMVYALYFITDTLAKLASNLVGASAWSAVNIAGNCVDLLCLGVWIAFLNRLGEVHKVVVLHAWTPLQEEHLMGQLSAINSSLTRSARRQ
jgi:hypothetical protein